jgi:FkbM family methyltransferase
MGMLARLHPIIAFLSLRLLRPLTRNRVYTVRHGLARGLRVRGGLDFLPLPMTPEEQFLDARSFRGMTVYDIGAFEGIHTCFFARAVGPEGRVVAFEPHPDNHRIVRERTQLNGFQHVSIVPVALGASESLATLAVPRGERSMGTLDRSRKTGFLSSGDVKTIDVPVEVLDHLRVQRELPTPDFVKIDVEGFELQVLRGMAKLLAEVGPALFIEVHGEDSGARASTAREVLGFLQSFGYGAYHVEAYRPVTAVDVPGGASVHLLCERVTPKGEA